MNYKFKTETGAKDALQHKSFSGPFSMYDVWALVNHKFLTDTLPGISAVFAREPNESQLDLKKDEEVEIDTRMWVEDPISFAKCVDRKELTVMKHMVEKRVELMKNEDFPM